MRGRGVLEDVEQRIIEGSGVLTALFTIKGVGEKVLIRGELGKFRGHDLYVDGKLVSLFDSRIISKESVSPDKKVKIDFPKGTTSSTHSVSKYLFQLNVDEIFQEEASKAASRSPSPTSDASVHSTPPSSPPIVSRSRSDSDASDESIERPPSPERDSIQSSATSFKPNMSKKNVRRAIQDLKTMEVVDPLRDQQPVLRDREGQLYFKGSARCVNGFNILFTRQNEALLVPGACVETTCLGKFIVDHRVVTDTDSRILARRKVELPVAEITNKDKPDADPKDPKISARRRLGF